MKYIIKGIEGIDHFVKTFSASIEPRDIMRQADQLFDKPIIIKESILKEGDEISVELTEFTTYSKREINTVTEFIVERHDSFLLKLIKL